MRGVAAGSVSWVVFPDVAHPRALRYLVPDLLPDYDADVMCEAVHRDGYHCTRRRGHGGRHAAGDGDWIVAVWP